MTGGRNHHDERQPLLAGQGRLDDTPVYPMIQMIRRVRNSYLNVAKCDLNVIQDAMVRDY